MSHAGAVSCSTAEGPSRWYRPEPPQACAASHGYPKTFPDSYRLKISRRLQALPSVRCWDPVQGWYRRTPCSN